MTQELIYTAVLIIIASSLPGLNFKDFPLGCYSYLGNEKYVYDNREDMIDAMHDLGYNSNILEIHSPHTSDTFNAYSDYGDLFTKLSEQNIGFVIMDKRWDIDKQFSTYPLSTSSYYQFEAKYNNDAEIVTGDLQHSEKWYTTREKHGLERIGHLDNNGYWWECIPEQDDPGYAYTDLFYRWQNASGDSIRIGQEFLIKRPIDSNIDDHYIYITYNFHIESVRIGLDLDFPLVSFHPCGYRYHNNDPNTWYESTPRPLAHTNMTNLTVGEQTDFTWGDYLNLPSPTDEINVTIKISYNDLMADSLLWYGSWSHWNLVNLNPRMYWHDNCELSLKSVEIEDQLYHDIVMNSSLAQSIGNQISDFPSSSNGFQGIYSLDEPMQGQWEAYKVIQDAMPTGLEFMTASYDKHYRKFPMVADSVYTVDLIPEIYTSRRVTHESATAVFSDQKFPALQQELDGRICCSEKT